MTIQAIDGDDVTSTRKEAKFHAETIEDPNEVAMKKVSELIAAR